MRADVDFEDYVLSLANTLTDKYGLHPDDAFELIEFYDKPVIRWQEAGVPVRVAASTLYTRFEAITSAQPNPRVEGAHYGRRHFFADVYDDLRSQGFTATKAQLAIDIYRQDIHSYYKHSVSADKTATVVATTYRRFYK